MIIPHHFQIIQFKDLINHHSSHIIQFKDLINHHSYYIIQFNFQIDHHLVYIIYFNAINLSYVKNFNQTLFIIILKC